jgi:multiple sugar transport system permease protein
VSLLAHARDAGDRDAARAAPQGHGLWSGIVNSAYFFLLPWLIGVVVLMLAPIIWSFVISFTNYQFSAKTDFVGFSNYQTMLFNDPRFIQSIKVTAIYMFVGVPLQVAFSLLIAIALNKRFMGADLYRSALFVPSLLSGSVAVAILWTQVFGNPGLLNEALALFGIKGANWLNDPRYAIYTIIAMRVWEFGSSMVIFLAALRQIPKELLEAALIDGTNAWTRFTYVVLPLIAPIVVFNLIMQLISASQTFTQAYVLSGGTGAPANSLLFYTLYLYQRGLVSFQMGYASAMAWLLLVVMGIVTFLILRFGRRWTDNV